ncbi:hypothetical protein, partial [Rhizobium sp. BK376]|uniref:hypothetical protein n=1 Tax=Rhizobium sp. BK376 TaxID=2512149 RepID=UPI0010E974FB
VCPLWHADIPSDPTSESTAISRQLHHSNGHDQLYGSANLDADPQKEMMRLQYLKKLEILSDAEYEEQVFRLTQHEEQMPQRRHLN